ncbi:TerC family protein [Arachnia propionica]|uniref:TerC family protein n=1 Tax=Arachnia propionica TaxID=1750 RepID=A0A3P1T5S9_9ACTN|nr:TerC family protein [Arachnia propionica]RRD04555.1 TerC family protein [Arachnia propionica]
MSVPLWVWALTIVVIVGLLAFDFFFHVRKAHSPTLKEAAVWSAIYVGLAIVFGIFVLVFGGHEMGADYFTGWLVEKALSVDNLFVFLIIMGSFAVPREDQQKVLLFGIVFALIARSAFIAAGKAMVEAWSWTFYFFGLILIVTAGKLLVPEGAESDEADNFVIRLARKYLHTSNHYDGDKLFTIENGRRVLTPMLLVMVAIGGTDILFAVDSVPAIYGITTNVYIVFTATAFSMMGLRQLYFLIDDLLDRLIYLKYGLAAILGFIGVKLILEALHTNTLPFINGGQHVPVFVFDKIQALLVVVGLLTITVVASLFSRKGAVASVVKTLDRKCHAYLHDEYHGAEEERTALYEDILRREAKLKTLDPELVEHYMKVTGAELALAKVHSVHGDV